MAYTGPFADLETCPYCSEPRYDPITFVSTQRKVSRQKFYTLPLGPQIQALWSSPESAENMMHRERETAKIVEELHVNDGRLKSYDDIYSGSDYLDAVSQDKIASGDTVLMFSVDGAQLYRNKVSNCWIYIWVILDLPPWLRYKKRYVLPGGFMGGPKKPIHPDSMIFPGFHHIVALQREGLRVWDASRKRYFKSRPFFALGTADGPGVTFLNGLVGHHGRIGCRLYCDLVGRHKPGGSHYYPARLKPHNYSVRGCDHGDVDFHVISPPNAERYRKNLENVLLSTNENNYKARRLATGICKPSLLSAMHQDRFLGMPGCCGSDIMHLLCLNLPDLFIPLWRGTFTYENSDNKATWDWAVLQGDVWTQHGQAVANATPYLPGSFGRPPRNPAEKINSGYKAWEFMLYLYGLGPGLLYNVLPEKYWKNFCKVVFGVRLILQKSILAEELLEAHIALAESAKEFEELYYQRRTDRLHFV